MANAKNKALVYTLSIDEAMSDLNHECLGADASEIAKWIGETETSLIETKASMEYLEARKKNLISWYKSKMRNG